MFGNPQKKFLKAAAAGDVPALSAYIEKNAYDINTRGSGGMTALSMAAANGQLEAVRLLIDKGAATEVADDGGKTALVKAVEKCQTEAARALIAAGANVNAHDNGFVTALHWAGINNDVEAAKMLVAAKADVNATAKQWKRNALHYAIANKSGIVAEFLLAQGARTDIPDSDGNTALALAKTYDPRLVPLIEEAGKRPVTPPAAVAPAPADSAESWTLLSKGKVAHLGVYPQINRRITEIFNFESRERVTLSENLKTGAETVAPAEKFETLAEGAVQQAEMQLKALGGQVPGSAPKASFTL